MRSALIQSLQTGTAYTENGAVTHTTTKSAVLDLFFVAGATRNMAKSEVVSLISSAWNEDPKLTFVLVLWARDIRGGAGERRFFRIARDYIIKISPAYKKLLQKFTPEYGRWDDLWSESDLPINQLAADVANVFKELLTEGSTKLALLCKWLPRKGIFAEALRKETGRSPKKYRKTLVEYTKVVEQLMSAKKWSDIDFSKLPSKAFNKYKKAWERHLPQEFEAFINKVLEGKATLNAKTLFPHEITFPLRHSSSSRDLKTAQAQWNSLAKYTGQASVLPVVDVSASMETRLPGSRAMQIDVSIALGIYFSEAIKGPFQDHIISFSGRPNLHKLSGTIGDKVQQVYRSGEDVSTNFLGIFEMLARVASRDKIAQSDMPSTLIIFSDMEFNHVGGSKTNYEKAKEVMEAAGYEMPTIVFWNLDGRTNNYPVQGHTPNTMLLSGFSPALLKTVLGGSMNPMDTMMQTLHNERYSPIWEEMEKI